MALCGCAKELGPQDLFREAFNKQMALNSYHSDAEVLLTSYYDETHVLDYKADIDKGKDKSQADDVAYYEFSCDIEGDDPYNSWALSKGVLLTDKSGEKYSESRDVVDADLSSGDRAQNYLDTFETIEKEKQDGADVLKMKVKEDSQDDLVALMMDHMFFNALLTDMFGQTGVGEIRFTDLTMRVGKKNVIERLSLLGNNVDGMFTFSIDMDFSAQNRASIPLFNEEDFPERMAVGIVGSNVILSMDLRSRAKYDMYVDSSGTEPYVVIYDLSDPNAQVMYGLLTTVIDDIDYFDGIMKEDEKYFAVYEKENIEINGHPATLCYAYYTDLPDQPFGYLHVDNENVGVFLFGYAGYERYKEVLDLLVFQVKDR